MSRKVYPRDLLKSLDWTGYTVPDFDCLNDDQINGLDFLVSQFSERDQNIILNYYKQDMTTQQAATSYHVDVHTVTSLIESSSTWMSNQDCLPYIVHGFQKWQSFMEQEIPKLEQQYSQIIHVCDLTGSIASLGLSNRAIYAMRRVDVANIRDLLLWYSAGQAVRDPGHFGIAGHRELKAMFISHSFIPDNFSPLMRTYYLSRIDFEYYAFKHLIEAYHAYK